MVLPPYEWVFPGFREAGRPKIITCDAKWAEDTFEYDNLQAVHHFPPDDQALLDELSRPSRACYESFGLTGYARIGSRVDDQGKSWILEVNGNPSFYGFHNISEEHGLDFKGIVKAIVSLACEEGKDQNGSGISGSP